MLTSIPAPFLEPYPRIISPLPVTSAVKNMYKSISNFCDWTRLLELLETKYPELCANMDLFFINELQIARLHDVWTHLVQGLIDKGIATPFTKWLTSQYLLPQPILLLLHRQWNPKCRPSLSQKTSLPLNLCHSAILPCHPKYFQQANVTYPILPCQPSSTILPFLWNQFQQFPLSKSTPTTWPTQGVSNVRKWDILCRTALNTTARSVGPKAIILPSAQTYQNIPPTFQMMITMTFTMMKLGPTLLANQPAIINNPPILIIYSIKSSFILHHQFHYGHLQFLPLLRHHRSDPRIALSNLLTHSMGTIWT